MAVNANTGMTGLPSAEVTTEKAQDMVLRSRRIVDIMASHLCQIGYDRTIFHAGLVVFINNEKLDFMNVQPNQVVEIRTIN